MDSKSGEPLLGANVILEGTALGAATDENGEYIIENVSIGTYTIIAMFIGYETLHKEIKIEADRSYIIDMKLSPSAIELQETKVTAEKRKEKVTEAPASIEIVSSRDIKQETTTNIGSYLKGLKGVDFTSSGINNYSISIRGFNSSFNTRVLTLTDGRVANIPALRVINYSTVPQSMDDIDKMEVVLGPATAMYGANAHSGVVNIISKSPAHSEGLTMSVSGSNDERQLRKVNGRYAKKLSDNFSLKLSGMYLHAYEWPYISETEYKSHLYPWTGNPYRMFDGKDNNPWTGPANPPDSAFNNSGIKVRIGDGEAMDTGDPDGDGVMGEDWYNGYDDDGDGLVDEDYFEADGIDNDGDGDIDELIDTGFDVWIDGYDNDGNGEADDSAERFENNSGTNFDPTWQYNLEEKNIIIKGGRADSLINDQPNPWYIPGVSLQFSDVKGTFKYDEEKVEFLFDVYIYDWGSDQIPGDPYLDKGGDGSFQKGECLSIFGGLSDACDVGLDGIPETGDYGEGDGNWQPGDGWVDSNENGIADYGSGGSYDTYIEPNESDYEDVWPPPNRQWDFGEEILGDYGRDGLPNTRDPGENDGILVAMDGFQGEIWNDVNADGKIDPSEYIDLNGNGRYDYPTGEFDSIFDTGDGVYGFAGESYTDNNGNGIYDSGEPYTDSNGDKQYTPPDYMDNFQHVGDVNGDGLSDFPDFEVDNRKVELRLDYDPSRNFNLTFQSGYSWTKTQQVTGTGRYLADGFEYTYYQFRGRFYNWYSQFYMNQSNSGNTRSYNLGSVVDDKSKNYAYQLQRSDDYHGLNTQLVWGLDYFKTLPSTNGTILNDGPNGYDNDGDNVWIGYDGIDQDGDGQPDDPFCPDSTKSGRRNGRQWNCYEGVDEEDEFDDPESNEYGFYYQSKTELFGTSRYELITAARWDLHDLLDEGIQFAPKLGFIYKPDEKSSFRFTYGKAFNTPNSITLYTDLFVRKQGIMDVYLRGNKSGTPYCRVGEECASGGHIGNGSVTGSIPGYYKHDGTFQSISSLSGDYFTGNSSTKPYDERVQGAPYFYNLSDAAPIDMIPLDTSRYLVYIPELSGGGVLYSPEESVSIPDVDPISTEKIQTVEFGYKGFLGRRTHVTLDYYLSYYEDFFSPPTFITPSVVLRSSVPNGNTDDMTIVGIMPVNSFETNAPYGTAWNGKDDDGDWDYWRNTNYEQLSPTNGSHWADDDKDGDGNTADPGEWGLVYWHTAANSIKDTLGYYFFEPADIIASDEGGITFQENVSAVTPDGETIDVNLTHTQAVGIDEYHPTVGLNEAELVPTGLFGEDGEQLLGPGLAYSPPHLVLSPMNYGEVWMQGLDIGLTHLLPEFNLVIDGNLSWYGTTEFYNELTKKNDPINAPQWKWNASIKWDSPIGAMTLNYRHVDEFTWNDGIWSGIIGPYDIFDCHYNLKLTSNLEMSVSALNILDDRHKELIGGAVMGRQVIMRMTSTF